MQTPAGVAMIVAGAASACVVVFLLWHRVAGVVALGLVGAAGVLTGAGALLVQDDVGVVSWIVTVVAFLVLTPIHARLVFGRPGPTRGAMVAARGSAA